MLRKYMMSAVFLCIIVLWSSNVSIIKETSPIKEQDIIEETVIEDIVEELPCHYDIDMEFSNIINIKYIPRYIPSVSETVTVIEPPFASSIVEEVWVPYLATSYNVSEGSHGNKGAELYGRNVVAMWQSDTDYTKYHSMIEPFKSFICDKELAKKYGALPYGTKIEIRIWDNTKGGYNYLGVYEILDDSPTTIYNLSEKSTQLCSNKNVFYFDYDWTDTDYKGNPIKESLHRGYIPNWKAEYNNNVRGWLDIANSYIGMAIVEIRVID